MLDVNNFFSFQIHGGADHGGGVADTVGHLLASLEGLVSKGESSDVFGSLFPGIAALDNIHPLFVHFPIAFLTGFFILDLLGTFTNKPGWRSAASAMLYFGTVGAALTVATGLQAAQTVAHGGDVHDIMETHRRIGISILALSVVLSLWRLFAGRLIRGAANGFFLLLSAFLSVLVFIGADLGGLMVYEFGVAVKRTVDVSEATAHDHVDSTANGHSHDPGHSDPHDHSDSRSDHRH